MNRFFIVQLLSIMLLLFYAVPTYVMPLLEPIWLQPGQIKFQALRSQGVANMLAEQLNSPVDNNGLSNVNLDSFPYEVSVQYLSDVDLTEAQLSTLQKNSFWVHPEMLVSYQLLEQHNRVLIIGNADTPKESALSYSQREIMGTVFLLTQKLNSTPIENWGTLAKQLTIEFRYPITVLPIEEVSLSKDKMTQLQQGRLVTQIAQEGYQYGSGIDWFYQQLPNGSILIGGPIAPSITDKLILGNISIFLAIGVFIALILILWLLPTWRSTSYLNQITSKFSAQDYSSRMPILFASLLNPQARTFNQMAQRTEQLFFDNQQLIRTSSKALKQPLDKLEAQLDQYKKSEKPLIEALDHMEQSINDMRDITSLILLIGKFNREKENLTVVGIELNKWVNTQSSQWQTQLDGKLTIINHTASDIQSKVKIDIEPYYLNIAILNMLRLSLPTLNALELHITTTPQVSQITTYQNDNETSAKMLIELSGQYLLQLAQQYKGQILHNKSNGTITLEIPNVLS